MRLVLSTWLCACAAGGSAAGAGGGAGSGGGGFDAVGGSAGADEPLFTEVFGHSASYLYKLEPKTNKMTEVGRFEGCNYLVDIAIDRKGRMLASSLSSLWEIDPATAKCTLIAEGNFPNALSFMPAGTLDPEEEALVGYINVRYTRIDTVTGALTDIGPITGGYLSSGDLVSVEGGKAYLTVIGNGCEDCLVEIDPKTGDLTAQYGDLGYTQVYGLAFWGGAAYGFSQGGDLFRIAFDGGNMTTTLIDVPNAPPDLSFAGAGSSTHVPLAP